MTHIQTALLVVVWSVASTLLATGYVKNRAHKDETIEQEFTELALQKQDRMRIIPIEKKQDQLWQWPEVPAAPVAPAPTPIVQQAPTVEPPKEKERKSPNVCERHGGWKVSTKHGKSWHCAFHKRSV